jgi:hypothetical protein
MPTPTRCAAVPASAPDLRRIARPESVVILAATVRAARELMREERIGRLKEQLSEPADSAYGVPSARLARRVLDSLRQA